MPRAVPELDELAALQDQVGNQYLATSFELVPFDDETGFDDTTALDAYGLTDEECHDRLVVFAQANGSGSQYAIWRADDRDDLAALPVVVLGDEGGEHVVARNLVELFHLLTADIDPIVDHDEVFFTPDEDHEPSGGHEAFVTWVRDRFGLEPTADPGAIVTAARQEYGARFESWIRPFLPS